VVALLLCWLRIEGCGPDGRVEVSLLRVFGLEDLILLAVCSCVCTVVLTHSVWGSEGYLYVERRYVQNTPIKLLQGFQFQTQCRAEYKNRMPICPFRHPFPFSPTHHFLAPLSYLTRPHLRPRNSIAVEAVVDVGGVPRVCHLNVARNDDRRGPAAAAADRRLDLRALLELQGHKVTAEQS